MECTDLSVRITTHTYGATVEGEQRAQSRSERKDDHFAPTVTLARS
ncbi:hypothetical protein ACIQ7Q_34435 [Streptomyces sp. NPDC096176]